MSSAPVPAPKVAQMMIAGRDSLRDRVFPPIYRSVVGMRRKQICEYAYQHGVDITEACYALIAQYRSEPLSVILGAALVDEIEARERVGWSEF
jgi:hypothetical protein